MKADDEDYNDLQEYLEGGTEVSQAAARRLDVRAVRNGQMSQAEFDRLWGDRS
jgi:hypothetical protein